MSGTTIKAVRISNHDRIALERLRSFLSVAFTGATINGHPVDESVAALSRVLASAKLPVGYAPNPLHPSHKTRISVDASTWDEICIYCGHTDISGGGWGRLAEPCPATPEQRSTKRWE